MRFRLYPTPTQEEGMRTHCAQARFVWNLALEQASMYRPEWGPTPGYVAQSAQLTEARAANGWLAAGSFTVQQQALRDFDQARKNWWAGTHGRPTWRRKGRHVAAKAGLNREILARRWGLFARRLGEKAALVGVEVVKANASNTSRRCHACGHVAAENRKSQAVFGCVTCGHVAHADVNAAMNVLAAGRALTAQGEVVVVASTNCEPQHAPPTAA